MRGPGGLPGDRPATSHLLAAILMAEFSFLYLRLFPLTGSGSWCAALGRVFASGKLGRGRGTGLAGEELGNAGICKCEADGIGVMTVAILG